MTAIQISEKYGESRDILTLMLYHGAQISDIDEGK